MNDEQTNQILHKLIKLKPRYQCVGCDSHYDAVDDEIAGLDEDGQAICNQCVSDCEYVRVRLTSYLVHIDDVVRDHVDGHYYLAEDCGECFDCGEQLSRRNLIAALANESLDGVNVCSTCINCGDWYYCDDENAYAHADITHYCDDCDRTTLALCDSCDRTALMRYSTDVLREIGHKAMINGRWHTSSRATFQNALVYGIELETDTRDGNDAEDIANHLLENTSFADYGICKEDGSVDGAEIVTLPACLSSHRNNYDWKGWCATLSEVARGHHGNGNGIHIHVNKAGLSRLTIAKMLHFAHNLDNLKMLSAIAQRDISRNTYCRPEPGEYGSVGKSAYKALNGTGKYTPLNVTRKTVEFRIFKANLTPERIFKNIEFCESLVQFCRVVSIRENTGSNYLQYVADNSRDYPNLFKFVTLREVSKLCA